MEGHRGGADKQGATCYWGSPTGKKVLDSVHHMQCIQNAWRAGSKRRVEHGQLRKYYQEAAPIDKRRKLRETRLEDL